MKIMDDGRTNPRIIFSPEEVMALIRERADAAGYADRATSAIQCAFRPSDCNLRTEDLLVWEPPEIIIMVSNIKDSREIIHGEGEE